MLDDLQAVDLVERAELGGEAVELAQVADREADPGEPDGLGAALGPGLVVGGVRERGRLVAEDAANIAKAPLPLPASMVRTGPPAEKRSTQRHRS